jgi:hypothetical protein
VKTHLSFLLSSEFSAVLIALAGCSEGDPSIADRQHEYKEVALQSPKALTDRAYSATYALTSREYQHKTSVDQMLLAAL